MGLKEYASSVYAVPQRFDWGGAFTKLSIKPSHMMADVTPQR